MRALQGGVSANTKLSQLVRSKYRPDIDGLRAVAILSVLGFHGSPGRLPGGLIGVDVFFVISGFLISTIILENLKRGSFSFVSFYVRRVRRVLPALLVVLGACFAVGWVVLLSDAYEQLGKQIAGAAGFISNFILWGESGYFDASAATKPLLHLWSLGIEEQFYLAWPPILWLAWRCRLNLLVVILAIIAVSFALNVGIVQRDTVAAFYAPYTRSWELLAGALLAYLTIEKPMLFAGFKYLRNAQSALGTALIVAGMLTITHDRAFPGWWALLPTVGTVLIISAGADPWINRVVLSHRALVWIGLISYPIYLWHWPLLSFARIVENDMPSRGLRTAAIAYSIAFAWLTYRLIETPLRFGAHGRAKAAALLSSMIIVGALGLLCYMQGGFNFRFPKAVQWLTASSYNPQESEGSCFLDREQDFRAFAACPSFPTVAGRRSIFLWGDSHAAHLYPGYKATFGPDFNIIQRTASACPPLLGFEETNTRYCRTINDRVVDQIAAEKPDKVVLAARWTIYDWRTKLAFTIARLREIGIRRIDLIGPVPQWPENLPTLLYRTYRADPAHHVPTRMLNSETIKLDRLIHQFADEMTINYISPIEILCDRDGCLTRLGDTSESLLQFDKDHLTAQGSGYLVSRFPRD
jgi:peptidoglycan/LPS O-acetylase OafA/YrhL